MFEEGTLVRFTADWCGPCKAYKPTWDKHADDNPDTPHHVVDVDEEPDMAKAFGVMSIPAVFVIAGGEPVRIDPYELP